LFNLGWLELLLFSTKAYGIMHYASEGDGSGFDRPTESGALAG
jgi:hypothetical protein